MENAFLRLVLANAVFEKRAIFDGLLVLGTNVAVFRAVVEPVYLSFKQNLQNVC